MRPTSRSDGGAEGEPEHGVGHPFAGENGRTVGAEAKKRSMAERDDPGQPENEVERQGEQAGDENFVDDSRTRRQCENQGEDRDPEHDFRPSPARAPLQMRSQTARRFGGVGRAHRSPPRANKPCGRTISVTTITA